MLYRHCVLECRNADTFNREWVERYVACTKRIRLVHTGGKVLVCIRAQTLPYTQAHETASLPFYSHRTFLTNANFSIILFYILSFFFVIFMCSFLRPAREAFSYGYEALFVSVETCARCNRKLLTSFRSIFIQLVLFTQTNTYSNERNRRKPKENRAISTEMYSK